MKSEEGPRGVSNRTRSNFNSGQGQIIDALSKTGLKHIQACSFVNPRLVPGWADAEKVVKASMRMRMWSTPAFILTGMGLIGHWHLRTNLRSLARFPLTASEGFTKKNLNRTHAENMAAMEGTSGLILNLAFLLIELV